MRGLGAALSGCQVILGKDCGGAQYIQLFCNSRAEFATRLCSVDAVVIKGGEVVAIIEIEESDIRPMALCGKVSVSAHASYFIHRRQAHPIAHRVAFVQVIDTKKLSEGSSKVAQCQNLLELNRNSLSAGDKDVAYDIFHGDIAEFERPEAQRELQEHLLETISL